MGLFLLQPKFGGKIIDIVSGDIRTPEEKARALGAVKDTILSIFLIVIVGYDPCLSTFWLTLLFDYFDLDEIVVLICQLNFLVS